MTKAEKLLIAGLAEARADLAFIRDHTEDVAMRKMLEAALDVSGRYLQDGRFEARHADAVGRYFFSRP